MFGTIGALQRSAVKKKPRSMRILARILTVKILSWRLEHDTHSLSPILRLTLVAMPPHCDRRCPPIVALCEGEPAVQLLFGGRFQRGIPLCHDWAKHLQIEDFLSHREAFVDQSCSVTHHQAVNNSEEMELLVARSQNTDGEVFTKRLATTRSTPRNTTSMTPFHILMIR